MPAGLEAQESQLAVDRYYETGARRETQMSKVEVLSVQQACEHHHVGSTPKNI